VTQHAQPAIRVLAWLLVPALAVAGAARAQAPAPARIGYVDMKRLLDAAPQVVAGRHTLEREFAARDEALKADEKRAADLRARQASGAVAPGTPEADALQRELDALDRSIRRNRDALRAELKTRSDQELDRSWREINDTVVEFAREQGYDLIVPSPVIYASPRVDITDRILDRLRRQGAKATP
jgi:outer membrane protein